MDNLELDARRLRNDRRLTGRLARVAVLPVAVVTLAACNQAPNQPPSLGAISAQYVAVDKVLTVRLPFDDDRPATVEFAFSSDNEAVLAAVGLTALGQGLDRVIQVDPVPGRQVRHR